MDRGVGGCTSRKKLEEVDKNDKSGRKRTEVDNMDRNKHFGLYLKIYLSPRGDQRAGEEHERQAPRATQVCGRRLALNAHTVVEGKK